MFKNHFYYILLFTLTTILACQDNNYVSIDRTKVTERRDVSIIPKTKPLDILFVIDSSKSMLDEQQLVSQNFTTISDPSTECTEKRCNFCNQAPEKLGFLETIACSANDFRIGFITPDLENDKGQLIDLGGQRKFFIDAAVDNKIEIINKFKQGINVGGNGSTFEQGLLAAWSTLNPANNGERYFSNWVRKDGKLVIVFISDEDDCSIGDSGFKDESGNSINNPFGDACLKYPSSLYPLSGEDGIVALYKSLKDNPEKDLLVSGIIGAAPIAQSLEAIDCSLNENLETVAAALCKDPNTGELVSSVSSEGACGGERYREVIKSFGDLFETICQQDFKESLKKIADFAIIGSGYNLSRKPKCDNAQEIDQLMSDCQNEVVVVKRKNDFTLSREVLKTLNQCGNTPSDACIVKPCPTDSRQDCWLYERTNSNGQEGQRVRFYGEDILPENNEGIEIFFIVEPLK